MIHPIILLYPLSYLILLFRQAHRGQGNITFAVFSCEKWCKFNLSRWIEIAGGLKKSPLVARRPNSWPFSKLLFFSRPRKFQKVERPDPYKKEIERKGSRSCSGLLFWNWERERRSLELEDDLPKMESPNWPSGNLGWDRRYGGRCQPTFCRECKLFLSLPLICKP